MTKTVILEINDLGNFEEGWPINLTIKDENNRLVVDGIRGHLSPAPTLKEQYQTWQQHYYSWGKKTRWGRALVPPDVVIIHNSSINDCQESAEELTKTLNEWLNNSNLSDIRDKLLYHANPDRQAVQLIIRTANPALQKLPWHEWNFFRDYYQSKNISFTVRNNRPLETLANPVKILVVLGSDESIDIEPDYEEIKNWFQGADIEPLPQPKRKDFCTKLRSQPWDILFFAGHSNTDDEAQQGFIYLNKEDKFSFSELKYTLQTHLTRNLKLAIFNSCDGLGLAQELMSLGIPNVIVMRERIDDRVALEFLKSFLESFATKKKPLSEAVQEARHILFELQEPEFPNASWLPVLFQNPEQPPLYYPPTPRSIMSKIAPLYKKFKWIIFLALIILSLGTVLVIDLFSVSNKIPACQLTEKEEWLSCGEKTILKTENDQDQELKNEGIKYYKQRKYEQAVKSFDAAFEKTKDPEALIFKNNALLKTAKERENQIITIAVAIPLSKNELNVDTRYLNKNILEAVAQKQNEFNNPDNKNQWKLQVLIANDGNDPGKDNDPGQAKKVAEQLVERDIIAVMGHYASRVTKTVSETYAPNKIVFLSAHSGSSTLTTKMDNTFFFRVVNETEQQTNKLAEYLKESGHKKLSKYGSERSYSASFIEDFTKKWNSFGSEYKFVEESKNDLEDPINVSDTLTKAINEGASAIILCPDVNTKGTESNTTKEVISKNNNQLLIAGCNPLYHRYYFDTINWFNKNNLVVSLFWYPDEETKKKYRDFWGNEKEQDVMRYALAYDAMQVLIDATSKLFEEQKTPNSLELQKILVDNFKTNGLTGEISLKGSERKEDIISIIKHECQSTGNCKWMKVE